MRSMEFMLVEFHRSFGATINTVPTVPSDRDRTMRHRLVTEELGETRDALVAGDFPAFVDGLIDSLYVLVGTNVTYGLLTVQPIYCLPIRAPGFPMEYGKNIIAGILDGMMKVADLVLDPEKNTAVDTMVVELAMNKLIADCLSLLHLCSVDAMHVFAEVHLANMRKLGPDGLPLKREDGKVMKPVGWTPPEIKRVLADQARRFDYPLRKE